METERSDIPSTGKRSVPGYAVCLIAFAFIVWAFYPGLMTPDSVANLTQGRAGVYSDINSPVMAWLWGTLDALVPGPGLIFVIHVAIFWLACGIFWNATHKKSRWLGIGLVVFGFAPHILAPMIVVWKDVALGVSLFMATALLYLARERRSRLVLGFAAVFLFYGSAMRLNAWPAVLPIALWGTWIGAEIFEFKARRWITAAAFLVLVVLLSSSVYLINDRLTEGRTDHPFEQIYVYDLAALSIAKDRSVFPEFVNADPNFSLETVRARYNERSVSDLIFRDVPNAGDRPPVGLSNDDTRVAELRRAWMDAILENPIGYLRHRSAVFAQLIGLGRSVTAPYVVEGSESNPPEYRPTPNVGHAVVMTYLGAFRRPFSQTFFFRAVIWIVLCVGLAIIAIRRRLRADWDLVFTLAASSLLFIAAYFPTAPSTEFRYLYWPAIASAVAVMFGIYLLRKEREV